MWFIWKIFKWTEKTEKIYIVTIQSMFHLNYKHNYNINNKVKSLSMTMQTQNFIVVLWKSVYVSPRDLLDSIIISVMVDTKSSTIDWCLY